jgi:hypothetical protein
MECGGRAAAFIFARSTAETYPNGRTHPNMKAAARAAALHKGRALTLNARHGSRGVLMECGGLAAAFIFARSTAETYPNGRMRANMKAAAKAAALHTGLNTDFAG